jgi:hypothetical protein
MKYKILLFVFVDLLVALNTRAQDFWELIPFPDSLGIADIAVVSQGTIFVGTVTDNCNFNGIYRSSNNGQSWEHVLNTGLSQVHSIGIDKTGNIYSGTAGAQTFWKSTDNGQNWQSLPFHYLYSITKFYSFGNDSLLLGCSKTLGALLLRTYDGGITFDTLFQTYNHVSEFVSDIAIAPNGDIYIGLQGWSPNAGGLLKSVDNGATWQCLGMVGYQVKNIEINAQGDVFIGAGDDGTFAIYDDNPEEIKLIFWPSNKGMVLNSAGYLFANSDWPEGTLKSIDSGMTFEWVSIGANNGPIGSLFVDKYNYIYGIDDGFPGLYRSKLPTYTSVFTLQGIKNESFDITMNETNSQITCSFPNPILMSGKWNAFIVNMDGKVLLHEIKNIENGKCRFDVRDFPSGVYCVNFINSIHNYSEKFAKPK